MNSFVDQQSSPTSSVTTASGVVPPQTMNNSSPSNYAMATPDKMLTTVAEGTENSYGTTHTTAESNHYLHQQNGHNHIDASPLVSPSRATGITPPRPPPVAPPAPPPLPGNTGLAPLQLPLQAKISKTAGSFSMAVRDGM